LVLVFRAFARFIYIYSLSDVGFEAIKFSKELLDGFNQCQAAAKKCLNALNISLEYIHKINIIL